MEIVFNCLLRNAQYLLSSIFDKIIQNCQNSLKKIKVIFVFDFNSFDLIYCICHCTHAHAHAHAHTHTHTHTLKTSRSLHVVGLFCV